MCGRPDSCRVGVWAGQDAESGSVPTWSPKTQNDTTAPSHGTMGEWAEEEGEKLIIMSHQFKHLDAWWRMTFVSYFKSNTCFVPLFENVRIEAEWNPEPNQTNLTRLKAANQSCESAHPFFPQHFICLGDDKVLGCGLLLSQVQIKLYSKKKSISIFWGEKIHDMNWAKFWILSDKNCRRTDSNAYCHQGSLIRDLQTRCLDKFFQWSAT